VHRLTGLGVSPGVVVGRAVLLMQHSLVLRFPITGERVEEELARLEEARTRSRQQLNEIKNRMASRSGADLRYLFEAQVLMLDDPMLVGRAREIVQEQRVNAEWAVQKTFDELSGLFDGIEDAYLRERRGDIGDVVGRLRMNLGRGRGRGREMFRDVDSASVLVADELTPSMAAQVDWDKILGFASDAGSQTHHTAILARSLKVPAVVGVDQASHRIAPGAVVVIDGTTGEIIVDPTPAVEGDARRRAFVRVGVAEGPEPATGAPVVTADGVAISLQANIELPDDIAVARSYGAESIGLFRSEFLLAVHHSEALDEEVQYSAYRTLLEGMAPGTVTVRTFDVDEGQLPTWQRAAEEVRLGGREGPLGLRAIRLSLSRREVFKTQLRALLRASLHGHLRIIFPFVSGIEELREARAIVAEAAKELREKGHGEIPIPPLGVMIEIPSAAMTADLLAKEADFFSIGTNDLIQYSLAVDRTDARVSRLYEPLHPGVLRTIRAVVRAAQRRKIPVSVCGEMAADPAVLPLLVGMGLTEFSMNPGALPAVRKVVTTLHVGKARRLASKVLRLATVSEIEACLARAHRGTPGR
jgi:phosphoenolpyruvate-protein phosphotransferase (PTS system enzyme I)